MEQHNVSITFNKVKVNLFILVISANLFVKIIYGKF